MKDRKVIMVDFDGTCVTHAFPDVGKEIGAAPTLREIVANGHRLILSTMRSDIDPTKYPDMKEFAGNHLQAALDWFRSHEIELWGIQQNPDQKKWTHSPKIYANIYIDDAALGAPLITNFRISDRPFIDWAMARMMLIEMGVIKH